MNKTPDCLIIGGGLMGMLTARELVRAGLDVLLLERGQVGRESSWAGGGILSPLYPWRYSDPVSILAQASQQIYSQLADSLQAESGIDVQWTQSGLLMPGCDELTQAGAWAGQYGMRLQALSASEVADCEPSLAGGLAKKGGLYLPEVAQVRNPRMLQALRKSIEKSGVNIKTGCEIGQIQVAHGRVIGVETGLGEVISAGRVVVAGGAWSAGLLEPLGLALPVKPIRGQMLLFRADKDSLQRITLYEDRYVIPRRDGRVLVGSTLEDTGFEKATTESARQDLLAAAVEIIPALANYPIEKHWAGLRPASPDGVPFIGEHPEIAGLYVNTGHFRNGVVLGPASAALLRSIILKNKIEIPTAPYQPGLAQVGW